MSRQLWMAFHGDEVAEPELTTILFHHLGYGRLEPGSDEVVLSKEQDGDAALLMRFRHGALVDVNPGPALTEDDITSIRARIESAALASDGTQVGRNTFFSVPELTGWWRYKELFQLMPAPPEAPRPGMTMGLHPFIVEVSYPATNDRLVQLVREPYRAWEIGLLLGLIIHATISPSTRHAHHWMLDADGAKYLNEGYMIPGYMMKAEDFSSVEGLPPLEEVDDQAYHARTGIGAGDVIGVPASMTETLDRYFELSSSDRLRVLRAAYWLGHARDVWDLSHTAYYAAVITAVEVMLANPSEPCPECGLNRKGTTALFEEFLDTFAPQVGATARSRRDLYRARSKILHGRTLLRSDIPGAWAPIEPSEWEERERSFAARGLAQRAILNWLLNPRAR